MIDLYIFIVAEQYTEKDSIVKQPWFLDRVDDYWDDTYCDFYTRLDC